MDNKCLFHTLDIDLIMLFHTGRVKHLYAYTFASSQLPGAESVTVLGRVTVFTTCTKQELEILESINLPNAFFCEIIREMESHSTAVLQYYKYNRKSGKFCLFALLKCKPSSDLESCI